MSMLQLDILLSWGVIAAASGLLIFAAFKLDKVYKKHKAKKSGAVTQ